MKVLNDAALMPIEELFAESYMKVRDPGKAMRDALIATEGYAVANKRKRTGLLAAGRRMLSRPTVKAYLEHLRREVVEHIALDAEWFALRMIDYADVSIDDVVETIFLDAEGNEMVPDGFTQPARVFRKVRDDIDPGVLRALQEVEFDDFGGVKKVKLPDKLKAINHAAEYAGVRNHKGDVSDAAQTLVDFLNGIADKNGSTSLLPSEHEPALDAEFERVDA